MMWRIWAEFSARDLAAIDTNRHPHDYAELRAIMSRNTYKINKIKFVEQETINFNRTLNGVTD